MLQRYTAKSIRQSDLEKTLCSSFKLPFIKHILCVSHPQFFGAADLTDKLCPQKLQSSRGDRRTKRLGEQVKRKDETGKSKRSSSQKWKTGSTETWGAEGAWGTWERHVILLDLGRLENEVKGRCNQPERALAISLGLYSVSDSGLWKYFMQGINTI